MIWQQSQLTEQQSQLTEQQSRLQTWPTKS